MKPSMWQPRSLFHTAVTSIPSVSPDYDYVGAFDSAERKGTFTHILTMSPSSIVVVSLPVGEKWHTQLRGTNPLAVRSFFVLGTTS
jgi:hypothetical protein